MHAARPPDPPVTPRFAAPPLPRPRAAAKDTQGNDGYIGRRETSLTARTHESPLSADISDIYIRKPTFHREHTSGEVRTDLGWLHDGFCVLQCFLDLIGTHTKKVIERMHFLIAKGGDNLTCSGRLPFELANELSQG